MKRSDSMKIQFCGPSGIGKTTLAKYIGNQLNIPFIDGSYSNLVPSTKNIKHKDMLDRKPQDIYQEYVTLVSERSKAFNVDSYVSDRSFIDVLVYTISNLSSKLPKCDVEFMDNLCREMVLKTCTHLILLPYPANFITQIPIEDNHKRILNSYYQWSISELFKSILTDLWQGRFYKTNNGTYQGDIVLKDSDDSDITKVLILPYWDWGLRVKVVTDFLNS